MAMNKISSLRIAPVYNPDTKGIKQDGKTAVNTLKTPWGQPNDKLTGELQGPQMLSQAFEVNTKSDASKGIAQKLELPVLKGSFTSQEQFDKAWNDWKTEFNTSLEKYLDVPSADQVKSMKLNELEPVVRRWIEGVNQVADTVMKSSGSEEAYRGYFRQFGMKWLGAQADGFIDSLKENKDFVSDYQSARHALAREYGIIRNETYSDIVGTGVSWEVLKGHEQPGENQFPAYRPEDLKKYNYFAKIEEWKKPDQRVSKVLSETFGESVNDFVYGVTDEPNTLRGWNYLGISVVNEQNIKAAAGDDPDKTEADTRGVVVNVLAPTAMFHILGFDAFEADLTWFNDFKGLSGLQIPRAFEFNEFGSDIATVAFAAEFEKDGGLRELTKLLARGSDEDRHGFSRSIARKALESHLTPEEMTSLGKIDDLDERVVHLNDLLESKSIDGRGLVREYLKFAQPLIQQMIEHAKVTTPQKYKADES